MENIYNLIEKIAERSGFKLVELNINHKYKKIAISIYKPTGITTDDCRSLNNELLDDIDFIEKFKGNYNMEISSPGVDRIFKSIKEYTIFNGKEIKITTESMDSNIETYTGILKGIDDENNILIENKYDLYKIPYNKIKKGSLLFEKI